MTNLSGENNRKKDLKTLRYKFFLDCGWPVCFYIAYIFFGNILKHDFAFTPDEIIRQNLIVSSMHFVGIIVWSAMSYKIHPLKIARFKVVTLFLSILSTPFLINIFNSSYFILVIQSIFMLFACDSVPAMAVPYRHISTLRRFTYSSMSYALSRSVMSTITAFGLVYLFEYLGYWGIFIILIPALVGYYIAISYFERLEREVGGYY